MSINSDTPTNLVVGAGEAFVDQDSLGATTDNNVFRIDRTLFTPELNGTKGALLGTDYITNSEGVLEMSIPEFDATRLGYMWPGSTSGTETEFGASATVIDEDGTRRIPTTAYHDFELQIERLGGGEFQFEADNALNLGNLEATLADDGLAAPRMELHSRWDPADMTASPHRIRVLTSAS